MLCSLVSPHENTTSKRYTSIGVWCVFSLPLSYLPMSSNKHLWPLSNRLFCQNCCTLLSYRFIFTAFTIILCSPKTTWRPFPLVLYLPSGTSKTLRLIGCALCSSFLHAQRSPNDKRSCPSHLPYSKLSRRSFQNRAPCWTKQRKQISHEVIHMSVLQQNMGNNESQRACIHHIV